MKETYFGSDLQQLELLYKLKVKSSRVQVEIRAYLKPTPHILEKTNKNKIKQVSA